MPGATLEHRLRRWGDAMREALAALDGSAPDDPLVSQAFDALTTSFEALGDLPATLAALPGPEARALAPRLQELTRLNAVLTAAVGTDRERLLAHLRRAQDARRACRESRGEGRTGKSCDVEG